MNPSRFFILVAAALCLVHPLVETTCVGQESRPLPNEAGSLSLSRLEQAAERLPDTVVAFLEIQDLGSTVDMLLTHPLRGKVEELPAFAQFKESKQYSQFIGGVRLFEAGMGMRWPTAVKAVSANGIFLAAEPANEGVALLVHAENDAILDDLRKTVFPVIRGGLPGGENDPIERIRNDGSDIYSIRDESFVADMGEWYVLSNKREFLEQIIRLSNDPSAKATLAASEHFRKAIQLRPDSSLAWGYVNARTIRESGESVELYSGKTDNILAEMLFGGLMSTLKYTPVISLAARLERSRLELSVRTPHENQWAGEERAYFFGGTGDAKATALPQLEGRLFALSAYRDLSEMWLRAADLMTDQAVEGLAQADSQLAIFFSGKDFGEDILGSLGPKIELAATRQEFPEGRPTPAIKLPAFGLKFKMLDPEKTTKDFRRIFQSMIGFFNVVGAMEGNPPFDMDWERAEDYEIISGYYSSDMTDAEANEAPIQFNFSPAVVFANESIVIASTTALAKALSSSPVIDPSEYNTHAGLNATILGTVLRDNWEQLLAQNMLEKGHSKEAAEGEIGLLLDLLGFFEDADLQLHVLANELELRTGLNLRIPVAAAEADSNAE